MSWASKWNLVWHEKLMVVTTSEGNYFGLACTNAWVLEWLSLSFPGSMAFSWSMVGVRNKGEVGRPTLYIYILSCDTLALWQSGTDARGRLEDPAPDYLHSRCPHGEEFFRTPDIPESTASHQLFYPSQSMIGRRGRSEVFLADSMMLYKVALSCFLSVQIGPVTVENIQMY